MHFNLFAPAFADCLKIRNDALAFPVTIARGFGTLGSAQFRRQLLFIFRRPARFGFGPGALARLGDAGGNCLMAGWLGRGCLIGHGLILHLWWQEKNDEYVT